MKSVLKMTSIACLMTTASSVFAGPSANLQVKEAVTQEA